MGLQVILGPIWRAKSDADLMGLQVILRPIWRAKSDADL